MSFEEVNIITINDYLFVSKKSPLYVRHNYLYCSDIEKSSSLAGCHSSVLYLHEVKAVPYRWRDNEIIMLHWNISTGMVCNTLQVFYSGSYVLMSSTERKFCLTNNHLLYILYNYDSLIYHRHPCKFRVPFVNWSAALPVLLFYWINFPAASALDWCLFTFPAHIMISDKLIAMNKITNNK